MTCLRLLLGDQLDPQHPWFESVCDEVLYVLMEVRQETDYVLHHAQKIIAIFAAMRRFAERLQAAGHRVIYLHIDDPENLPSLTANLDRLIARHSITAFEYQPADEWRLDVQLAMLITTHWITIAHCRGGSGLVRHAWPACAAQSDNHWRMRMRTTSSD